MKKVEDLTKIFLEIDEELIRKGVEPYTRPFAACSEIAQHLFPGTNLPMDDPIFQSINQIYRDFYGSAYLHLPPAYIGCFMFRDVFLPIRLPVIYGEFLINPIDFLTDIPETQNLKRWLFKDHKAVLTFFDQVIDVMDFVYGIDDLEKGDKLPPKAIEFFYLAKQQMQAAAATLLGSFDKYAVIQNCCLATELLLKGALIAKKIDIETLKKKYGHDLKCLLKKNFDLLPGLNQDMLSDIIHKLPDYTKSRYELKDFSRLKLGEVFMKTQFISGDILRQFSDRNSRANFNMGQELDVTIRTFPEKQLE